MIEAPLNDVTKRQSMPQKNELHVGPWPLKWWLADFTTRDAVWVRAGHIVSGGFYRGFCGFCGSFRGWREDFDRESQERTSFRGS